LPNHLRPVHDAKLADTVAETAPRQAPEKPDAVAADSELSAMWDVVVPELDRAGLISPVDGFVVEMFLRHVLTARQAHAEIGESVVLYDDKLAGGAKKHPAEQVFRSESDMFLKYAQQLGMTFVARARTPATKVGDGDGEENPFASPAVG
jgi:P27 family predicted phage terminase small subunit